MEQVTIYAWRPAHGAVRRAFGDIPLGRFLFHLVNVLLFSTSRYGPSWSAWLGESEHFAGGREARFHTRSRTKLKADPTGYAENVPAVQGCPRVELLLQFPTVERETVIKSLTKFGTTAIANPLPRVCSRDTCAEELAVIIAAAGHIVL